MDKNDISISTVYLLNNMSSDTSTDKSTEEVSETSSSETSSSEAVEEDDPWGEYETDEEEFEGSSDEEEDSYDGEDTIERGKWIYDGCKTIDEMIQRLINKIEELRRLKEDGWEVEDTVDDDYAFLIQKEKVKDE